MYRGAQPRARPTTTPYRRRYSTNVVIRPAALRLLETNRNIFFTGKGGVGKTTLSCATAIALADLGKRVLLVSTDPASNLDEMLSVQLTNVPRPVPQVPRLLALNIDPDAAAKAYRERVLSPYRASLSTEDMSKMAEQLSGACTIEIAAFDEFSRLLSREPYNDSYGKGFDHIIFDTAPTGHTLRLLRLPQAWTGFLQSNSRGASCLGPHSGLQMHQSEFGAALNALTDPQRTAVALVTRPNGASLREADRTAQELRTLGLSNLKLFVNGVFRASNRKDPVAAALEDEGQRALEKMPPSLMDLPRVSIPLKPYNMVGIDFLRRVFSHDSSHDLLAAPVLPSPQLSVLPLSNLVDELSKQDSGLVMVMGKGGVGKTTIAAALATELATRGRMVHLSTTDPAAHVAAAVRDAVPNLQLSRIDPTLETQNYQKKILATKGAKLDAEGRAFLEEDLRSPCSEEVAVFHAFSRIVAQARAGLVVLDTAPTGHTLLLLDATGSYHREIMRNSSGTSSVSLTTPLMRLRDPTYTKIIIVTLAEPTPVTEAAHLQEDLRRAGIEPYAWVINSCLAVTDTSDPLLLNRIRGELTQIQRVTNSLAKKVFVVPWLPVAPVGLHGLQQLMHTAKSK